MSAAPSTGRATGSPGPKRKGGRPRRDEAEARVDHILAIATEFFLREGYSGTTIDGIAVAAGVSKRTIYSRYPSKEALFSAVLLRLDQHFTFEAFGADDGLPLAEGLRRRGVALLKIGLRPESQATISLMIRETHRFPEIAQMTLGAFRRDLTGHVESYLTLKQRQGQIRPLDIGAAADLFVQIISGEILRRGLLNLADPNAPDLEDFVAPVVDMLVFGVAPRA